MIQKLLIESVKQKRMTWRTGSKHVCRENGNMLKSSQRHCGLMRDNILFGPWKCCAAGCTFISFW